MGYKYIYKVIRQWKDEEGNIETEEVAARYLDRDLAEAYILSARLTAEQVDEVGVPVTPAGSANRWPPLHIAFRLVYDSIVDL